MVPLEQLPVPLEQLPVLLEQLFDQLSVPLEQLFVSHTTCMLWRNKIMKNENNKSQREPVISLRNWAPTFSRSGTIKKSALVACGVFLGVAVVLSTKVKVNEAALFLVLKDDVATSNVTVHIVIPVQSLQLFHNGQEFLWRPSPVAASVERSRDDQELAPKCPKPDRCVTILFSPIKGHETRQ